MDFDVLPHKIGNVTIDAPILTDKSALEAACRDALSKVAEAMQADVIYLHKDAFVHNESNWSFKANEAEDYYSSGLIPYWRGGLYRSFQVLDGGDWSEIDLAFTASYAPALERGGMPGEIPIEWAEDKIGDKAEAGVTYSIHPHPFTTAVAQKLAEGLETYGYLDLFGLHFSSHFKRLI